MTGYYRRDGKQYGVIGECKMVSSQTQGMGVVYIRNGQLYTMLKTKFIERFNKVPVVLDGGKKKKTSPYQYIDK